MTDKVELVADDIVNFVDDEQAKSDNDRKTALANVLFEWQAYYGRGDLPEHVKEFRDVVGEELLKRELDLGRREKHRVPAGDKAYLISVTETELKDRMDEKLKDELVERGEPV